MLLLSKHQIMFCILINIVVCKTIATDYSFSVPLLLYKFNWLLITNSFWQQQSYSHFATSRRSLLWKVIKYGCKLLDLQAKHAVIQPTPRWVWKFVRAYISDNALPYMTTKSIKSKNQENKNVFCLQRLHLKLCHIYKAMFVIGWTWTFALDLVFQVY